MSVGKSYVLLITLSGLMSEKSYSQDIPRVVKEESMALITPAPNLSQG